MNARSRAAQTGRGERPARQLKPSAKAISNAASLASQPASKQKSRKRPAADDLEQTEKPVTKKQRTKRVAASKPASGPSCSKTVPLLPADRSNITLKKGAHPDERFIREAYNEFSKIDSDKALKPSKHSARRRDVKAILPFLNKMSMPRKKHTALKLGDLEDDQVDAYLLSTDDAKRLLASNATVSAPIFVSGGAQPVFEGDVSPIEQVLHDWLLDSNEKHSLDDKSKLLGANTTPKTLSNLRSHFTSQNLPQRYPWNFPDIPNSMPSHCIPPFLHSSNCNLLRDILRTSLDADDEGICHPACTNRKLKGENSCQAHMLSLSSIALLHDAAKYWAGTIMIADPGTVTFAHWDKFAFGTWISCHEGEIGLGWLAHPNPTEQLAWQGHNRGMKGKWLFKVLREGDVVYMPPGTVHIAFRRPQGQQTLGFAGHVLRRTEVERWLRFLELEVLDAVKDFEAHREGMYEDMLPGLVSGARALLDQAEDPRSAAKFGGEDAVWRAQCLIKVLEVRCVQLRKLAKK